MKYIYRSRPGVGKKGKAANEAGKQPFYCRNIFDKKQIELKSAIQVYQTNLAELDQKLKKLMQNIKI